MISQRAVAGLSRPVERDWLELQMAAKCCVYCVSQYWRQSGESKPSAGEIGLRHGGPLWLAPCPQCLHSALSPPSPSHLLCVALSLGRVCRVCRSWSTWTQLEKKKGRQKEPLNLVHSIICSVAVLSHSWEILNTLYDNESAGDRHKYQRQSAKGLKCLVRLLITQICHWFHGFLNR